MTEKAIPERKTKFSELWLKNLEYGSWLSKKSEFVGSSSYCCKEIDVSNMRETALKSHMKSKKHTGKSHVLPNEIFSKLM